MSPQQLGRQFLPKLRYTEQRESEQERRKKTAIGGTETPPVTLAAADAAADAVMDAAAEAAAARADIYLRNRRIGPLGRGRLV
jgi:hypothetical protein